MKLSSVEATNFIYKTNNIQNKKNSNVNFSAGASVLDGMVNFWQMIDNYGRAAQFTAEDMFGTNFPRMWQGLMAGKKFTGKYNWKAFIQEATREMLTGPTMTFFPIAVLIFSKKAFGPTSNTKNENINNLSDIMNGIKQGSRESVRKDFFAKAIDDVLKNTLGSNNNKNFETNRQQLLDALIKYSDAFDNVQNETRHFFEKPNAKRAKEILSQEKENLKDTFAGILKRDLSSFDNLNFQTLKYTLTDAKCQSKTMSIGAENYFEFLASYIYDYTRKNKNADNMINTSRTAIRDFKNLYTANRLFTLFNMIVITGLLITQIPKLYTKGKVNPNAVEVYNQAKSIDGTSKEKEVNNVK